MMLVKVNFYLFTDRTLVSLLIFVKRNNLPSHKGQIIKPFSFCSLNDFLSGNIPSKVFWHGLSQLTLIRIMFIFTIIRLTMKFV